MRSGVRLNQRHGHRQERHERQRQSHRQVRRAQPGQEPAGAPSAPRSAVRESPSLAVAWQGKSQRTVAPCLWRDSCIWLCAMTRVAHCATHEADCARVRHGWQALCDAELATGDVKKLIKGGTACCALLWLQRALIFIKVRPWGMRAPPPISGASSRHCPSPPHLVHPRLWSRCMLVVVVPLRFIRPGVPAAWRPPAPSLPPCRLCAI